jgi:hypothetical protein
MARKNQVPVVGTRGLHTAQLSPRARTILKRRADAAARREYAPVLEAARAPIESARQGFRNEAASIRGSARMGEQSLDQALRGLASSGLKGRYLKQATQEFAARRADVASGTPYLLADARQARGEAIGEARTDLLTTRAEMKGSAASAFNQLLKEQRDKASGVLKERENESEKSSGFEFDERKLRNANIALNDALATWKSNPEYQEANPLTQIDHWRHLAQQMSGIYKGFDLAEAMEVIRRRVAKLRLQVAGPYRSQSSAPGIRRQASPHESRLRPPSSG